MTYHVEGYVFPYKDKDEHLAEIAATEKESARVKWLQDNPNIGVLNCAKNVFKYYKIVNGKAVSVREFGL